MNYKSRLARRLRGSTLPFTFFPAPLQSAFLAQHVRRRDAAGLAATGPGRRARGFSAIAASASQVGAIKDATQSSKLGFVYSVGQRGRERDHGIALAGAAVQPVDSTRLAGCVQRRVDEPAGQNRPSLP